MKKAVYEGIVHYAFEIGIVCKGALAIFQLIAGVLIFFITKTQIVSFVVSITQDELLEDPKDFISNHLVHSVTGLPAHFQYFAALYLIIHGAVKLFLVICLFKKKLWAYPVSIVVFAFFIFYDLYRFHHTHSMALLFLMVLDLAIIALTVGEYARVKRRRLV